MLPLVDSVVLNNNPRFAALYHDLTKNKLTAGGASTLDAKAAKESESLKDVGIVVIPGSRAQCQVMITISEPCAYATAPCLVQLLTSVR